VKETKVGVLLHRGFLTLPCFLRGCPLDEYARRRSCDELDEVVMNIRTFAEAVVGNDLRMMQLQPLPSHLLFDGPLTYISVVQVRPYRLGLAQIKFCGVDTSETV